MFYDFEISIIFKFIIEFIREFLNFTIFLNKKSFFYQNAFCKRNNVEDFLR